MEYQPLLWKSKLDFVILIKIKLVFFLEENMRHLCMSNVFISENVNKVSD